MTLGTSFCYPHSPEHSVHNIQVCKTSCTHSDPTSTSFLLRDICPVKHVCDLRFASHTLESVETPADPVLAYSYLYWYPCQYVQICAGCMGLRMAGGR